MQSVLEPLGIVYAGTEATGGADLGPLRELGMPVMDIDTDAAPYFDLHHTAEDTFDKVDPALVRLNVAAFAAMAYLAAEAEGGFGRLPPAQKLEPPAGPGSRDRVAWGPALPASVAAGPASVEGLVPDVRQVALDVRRRVRLDGEIPGPGRQGLDGRRSDVRAGDVHGIRQVASGPAIDDPIAREVHEWGCRPRSWWVESTTPWRSWVAGQDRHREGRQPVRVLALLAVILM